MPKIIQLSEKTINQIAAGEVVERPISVIKELVENAVDAGATEIIVRLERGGRNLISVQDNGCGIEKEQLPIAIQRHATSKLKENDINKIEFFGFRGEALPSIGSVAKLRISSKPLSQDMAYEIVVDGGDISGVTPSSLDAGTLVEVKDIFTFTPARLKFLKSESSEKSAAIDLINRFALANAHVAFILYIDGKKTIEIKGNKSEASSGYYQKILGDDFYNNSVAFEGAGNGIKIFGRASKPSYNCNNSTNIYTFVNKRSIKDKLLNVIIKSTYQNLIPNGRYPHIVLFIELDPYAVDVNVHPTKAEVRFRDQEQLRSLVYHTIRNALSASHLSQYAQSPTPERVIPNQVISNAKSSGTYRPVFAQALANFTAQAPKIERHEFLSEPPLHTFTPPSTQTVIERVIEHEYPLGFAKCQIANSYIIAENKDGLIIVDQHAAHERITLEQYKEQLLSKQIATQHLLIPIIINIGEAKLEFIRPILQDFHKFGIHLETSGTSEVLSRQLPQLFSKIDSKEFLLDLINHLYDAGDSKLIEEKIIEILGNIACKNSIKAGHNLSLIEMNALLRQIEKYPFTGSCNHGRPTFKQFTINELDKLFERV